jgi:hypothetical protein
VVTKTIEVAVKAATEREVVTETIEIAVCKAMMGNATAGKGMARKAGTKSAAEVADATTKMASTKAAAKVATTAKATAKVTAAAKSTSAATHGRSACGHWRRAQRQDSSNCQNRFAHRSLSFCASEPNRQCAGRGQSIR